LDFFEGFGEKEMMKNQKRTDGCFGIEYGVEVGKPRHYIHLKYEVENL
jgi:hypothetical protein